MPNGKEKTSKAINLALLLIISATGFACVHSLDTRLYNNLYYGYTDLVYFEQSLANFIHGHGLVSTGRGQETSLFHEHAYFTHFLVSLPVYRLFPHALTLFSLATLHMLAALALVFFLAKRILKSTALAWVCYFLFLSNVYLIMCAGCFWKWGFHPQVYYLAYFLALLYFWDKNKRAAVVFFCLALLTNELYAIPLFMTMLYFIIKEKGKNKTAPALAIVSLLYFLLVAEWLMPVLGAGEPAYQYHAVHLNTWSAFDFRIFLQLFIRYWKLLLIHFHFLPVFSPQVLILALPDSLVNTLSEFVIGYRLPANPSSWHSIPAFGFMIWATIGSFYLLTRLIRKRIYIYALSLGLIAFSVYLLFDSPIPRLARFKENKSLLTSLKKAEPLIAGSDSLCVARGLAAPFMHKRYLYEFPVNCHEAEYLLFRPSKVNLRKIAALHCQVVFKTPRLILLRNPSFGPKGTAYIPFPRPFS